MSTDVKEYMEALGQRARAASRAMARADSATRNKALSLIAEAIEREAEALRAANQQDLEAARANGLAPAMVDRLTLSDKAIGTMVEGLRQIVALPDPVGEISNMKTRPTGIQVGQMRVPLGVIGIIYEARPNVTVDAAGLCIKSGNATILRGGSEAIHCNRALAKIVKQGLIDAGLPEDGVQVVDTTDRAAVGALITMPQYVDVIVPRGGKGLIERLMRESRIPMIKHLDGVCHVYVDDSADPEMAVSIAHVSDNTDHSCPVLAVVVGHLWDGRVRAQRGRLPRWLQPDRSRSRLVAPAARWRPPGSSCCASWRRNPAGRAGCRGGARVPARHSCG